MSAILKVFPDHTIKDKTTWWIILDCGHWYHWTGDKKPDDKVDFPCPYEPTIKTVEVEK